jgi:uncharacterized protein involved in outer membrane biogenesis
VQTTLLGLAIAFILALIAALVGPYFIDWNQFRPQFEAEASRIVGAPVRVGGALDARLLPTPSLRLRAVTIGAASDASRVRADKLDVEFALGSLLRGEWRATELTLNGFGLDLSLDPHGKIIWPLSAGSVNLGSLAIDRLNLTGRVGLHDAASGAVIRLDDIAFSGDVRALAGAARGDGNFSHDGVRYPFRLSSGRSADGAGTRLHLNIDPGERPLSVDLDGVVTTDAQVPRFDGAVTLARALALRTGNAGGNTLQTPWKLSARVKADPAAAKFEQVETVYGSDDVGLKLSGTADMVFGRAPSLRATLSARQLDADRLLAKETAGAEPTRLVPWLRNLVAAIPAPWLTTRIEIGADAVTLGGRPVQNIAANFHSDADAWIVDRLEARAPGATQLALTGRLAPGAAFKGDLKVEAADPDALAIWLRGRGDPSLRAQKPLRIAGALSVAPDRMALDGIIAEIDGAAVEGRLALSDRAGGKSSKLDAAIKAERIDLDGMMSFARGFAGPQADWPDEALLALDIGHGVVGGQEVSPIVAEIGYGPNALTLANLKVGGAGGVALEGSGAFDRAATSGRLSLNAGAASLAQLTAFLAPVLPATVVTRLNALPAAQAAAPGAAHGAAKLKLSVNVDKADKPDHANAMATLDIETPHLKGTARASVTPALATLRSFDLDALAHGEVNIDTRLAADQGRTLLTLLGLDRIAAMGDGAAQLESTATGSWTAPLRFKVKLSGANLDADVQGTAEPSGGSMAGFWTGDPKASVTLAARKIDLAPLLDLTPGRWPASVISLSSRLTLAGQQLTFDDIDSTVSGSRVRGRLVLTRGAEPAFAGELGMDTLDLGAAFALAIGAAGHGADEPLSRSLLQGARGQLGFQALRGVLPGGVELRPLSGTLKGNGSSLTFEGVKGSIGGGEAKADITADSGSGGLAIDARVQLAGVDGAALSYRGLTMPAGRTALQMTLAARGRSAGAIAGALSGNGSLSIDNARIAGLDPRAFDVAVTASDAGLVADDRKLRDLVAPALMNTPLAVASAQIPFSIRDGSLRVASTLLEADDAKAIVSGGYDITADQVDIRASLTSTSIGTETSRPEIQIFTHGAPDRLNRSVDVALLSSWLAVRAIDRETRRLDSLERGEPVAPPPPAPPPPPTTAAIPPAVEQVAPAVVAPPQSAIPVVPVPGRDPRRREQKARVVAPPIAPAIPPVVHPPAPPPQTSSNFPPPGASVPPLPPPIEVRPAPGTVRQRPRAPLVLTPPVQN